MKKTIAEKRVELQRELRDIQDRVCASAKPEQVLRNRAVKILGILADIEGK